MSKVEKLLKETNPIVKDWMEKYFSNDEFLPLKSQIEYAINYTDPDYDRALLVRLGCELMGGNLKQALPGMVAWELFNISLLVTDDFFDQRKGFRMGQEPIYKKWNDKASVSLGFYFDSLAYEIIINSYKNNKQINPIDTVDVLTWSAKWQYFSQDQEEQLTKRNLDEITLEDYFDLIKNATAVGTAGAIELGGILGGASQAQRYQFREFGLDFGCLLQIRDDLIDYIDNESITQKSPFNDLLMKRKRLPFLVCYWKGNKTEKKKLLELIQKPTIEDNEISFVLDILTSHKVKYEIRRLVEKIHKRAVYRLETLPGNNDIKSYVLEWLSIMSSI